jgi:ADP-ribosylglycohydrolase
MDRASAIRGGIFGLLIGDAVGVPYEFREPETLPPLELLEMSPPEGFLRSHRGTPIGTWSDDGAQALCLLASLLDCGKLDADDLAQRLVNWYRGGYLAVRGIGGEQRVPPLSNLTSDALNHEGVGEAQTIRLCAEPIA